MIKILYNKQTGTFSQYPRKDDSEIDGLDTTIYDIYQQINLNPPNYDRETEKLETVIEVDHPAKTRTKSYTIVALTEEEQEVITSTKLNWSKYAKELIKYDDRPESPYKQIVKWAGNSNKMLILLMQISFQILTVQSPRRFKNLLKDLKLLMANNSVDFTPEQVAEIDRLFGVLGTNITWDDI